MKAATICVCSFYDPPIYKHKLCATFWLDDLTAWNLYSKEGEYGIENPCVGGLIPPRATKIWENHLRVVFSFLGNFPIGIFLCFPNQLASTGLPVVTWSTSKLHPVN